MNNLVIIGHPDKNSFCHNGIFKTISKILNDHPNQKIETIDLYEDKLHRDKKELVEKAAMKLYNYSSSIIAWGKGNGQFDIQRLPNEVQFSSLNAMVSTDVNADGKIDMVMGGNQFGFLPQFGRLDANYGLVLLNQGNRKLEVVEDKQSGLAITGQVRDMVLFQQAAQKKVLFIRNNQVPVFMKLK